MNGSSSFSRILFFIAGSLSFVVAMIGILVPFLPTVPLLLLTAYCFVKSSKRFHNWLMNSKLFGKIIKDYKEGKGIPVGIKIYSIILLWMAVGYTIIYVFKSETMKITLIIVAIAVTVHLVLLKTTNRNRPPM